MIHWAENMKKSYRHLRIGDQMGLEGSQSITAEPLDHPEWYIFQTVAQKELPVVAWLARNGVEYAWYPTETRWKNIARGRRRKVRYEAPIAPRYVFALFTHRPIWHILRERSVGKITGVICRDGEPLRIPESDIMNMQALPKRIAHIRDKMIRENTIMSGDKAEITDGPLTGWTVEVSRIDRGIAYFVAPLLGDREISIEIEKTRKVK